MSTALVCTGVQFPDSTIQTTAATALTTVTYANRASLRTTTPSANLTSIAVEGLGVFTYYGNNTEPDDDETCFVVSGSGGAWQLLSPSWDMVYANMEPDIEYIYNSMAGTSSSGTTTPTFVTPACLCGLYTPGCSNYVPTLKLFSICCTTQPFACVSQNYEAVWSTAVSGVCSGDIVYAQPINYVATCYMSCCCPSMPYYWACGPMPYTVTVACPGYVWISLMNYSAGSGWCPFNGSCTVWAISVLRCC